MEFNKIFAALLVAGILAMTAGIFSEEIFHVHPLKEAAFPAPATANSAPGEVAPAAEVIEPIAPLLAAANADNGAKVAKLCGACHDFTKGGPNKVGPNLWGVLGGKKAHKDDYAYSDAIKTKGGNWDPEELAHFIANPKGYAPGTKMGFAGLKKAQDRADLILWLNQQSDAPLPLK